MVNKENMRLWIEALHSDRYVRGLGYLRQLDDDDKETYCCMGVACVVAMSSGVELAVTNVDGYTSFDGQRGLMPWSVAEWLGLASQNPTLTDDASCIKANDELGLSFHHIADLLEKRYLEGEDERPTAD